MNFKPKAWMAVLPLVALSISCSKSDFSQENKPVITATQVAPQVAPQVPTPSVIPNVIPTPVIPTPVVPNVIPQPTVPVQPVVPSTNGTMTVNAILVHNMEYGNHVVGKDSFAVLRNGNQQVIAAGQINLDSAVNGQSLGMVGAYPGMQLSVGLDLLQPGATSGTGFLSLCPVADRTSFQCVGANTDGNRPIHWVNRSVPYSVQGNRVTVNNRAYGNGDDLNFAVSFAHPITLPVTGSTVASLVDASSPLILDLDQNGKLDLLAASSPMNKSRFDLIGDGKSELLTSRIGWIAPQDGLLALDLNGNKMIDSGKELFGEHSFDPAPTKRIRAKNFEHGFKALAIYDDNADRKIDSKDKIFDKLVVWQDKNSDGISQASEMRSLKETGVKRVYLKSKLVRENDPRRWNEGNILAFTSKYRAANNRKYLVGDVWFARERTTAKASMPKTNLKKTLNLKKKGS